MSEGTDTGKPAVGTSAGGAVASAVAEAAGDDGAGVAETASGGGLELDVEPSPEPDEEGADEQADAASAPANATASIQQDRVGIGSVCPTWDYVAVTPQSPQSPHSVRTFKRRAGRVSSTQQDALARLWSRYGQEADGTPLDSPSLFGRTAPLVLEVGFGMGEATATMAQEQPELDVLAIDVHTPGHGNLLKLLEAAELTNVRVVSGDARVLLAQMLPPASLHAVRVFFPDPWPKARHGKRRLVTSSFADLVATALVDGGTLHLATDIAAYAEGAREVLSGHPALELRDEVPWRSTTKFEQRGLDAGRPAYDVVAVRRPRDSG